jgi:hypothetical protein
VVPPPVVPRPRLVLVVRFRDVVLRLRAGALREAFAAAGARFAVERLPAVLRAGDARVALAVEDFARVGRLAVARLAGLRFAVERLAVDLRAPPREGPEDDVARAAEP